MIIAGTGHRPDKLGGYSDGAFFRLTTFVIDELKFLGSVDGIISGMALGFDTALALAAIELNIPLTCAIPFEGQQKMWSYEQQRVWKWIVARAQQVEFTSPPGYEPYKMQRRNRWMVDRCTELLALHDGSRGGTFNCVAYANERQKPIINLWPKWKVFNAGS